MSFLASFIAFFLLLFLGNVFLSALGSGAVFILACAAAALVLAWLLCLWEKLDRIEVKLERLLQAKEAPAPAQPGEAQEQ